ncbi:MAG: ABC transporter permease [Lentihominibacter sp.]|jgi:ABC-type uncharacterized transport system permease subunit
MKNIVRITKRDDLPLNKEIVITIMAILLSIVCAGLIILAFGLNPIDVFKQMIVGSLGTEMRIKSMLTKAVPLIITSLGIIVAFKMKFWNIGAEGQITMGALGATFVALNMSPGTPQVIAIILMILAAMLCGGIWAFIPAFFKAKWGINETVFTLMMNYIAIKFVMYLQAGPWRDPGFNGFPRISNFSENFILPKTWGVNIGWVFAILGVIFIYFLINHTKLGYEISVIGESVETARYAGMNIGKVIVVAMLISGGLCGLTGMIQASGMELTLVSTIAGGCGFTAIITAWLSKLNPITTLFVCLAFAILVQGGDYIQIALGVSSSVSDVVQGLILFFVLGSEFFIRYRVHFGKVKEVA